MEYENIGLDAEDSGPAVTIREVSMPLPISFHTC